MVRPLSSRRYRAKVGAPKNRIADTGRDAGNGRSAVAMLRPAGMNWLHKSNWLESPSIARSGTMAKNATAGTLFCHRGVRIARVDKPQDPPAQHRENKKSHEVDAADDQDWLGRTTAGLV